MLLYPWLPVRYLSRFQYPTLDDIRNIDCPVLIAHSQQDDIIPYSHGRALFEAAPEPKDFMEMTGSHNDGFLVTGQPYLDGLKAFLARNIER